ncbi:hypothetical protein AWB81_05469 [Caballeronia arationis]|jgi:hypothetical protein|uniref:hypothetical protein n=1 Tax=Caballeronia arationis TaxID=1777142 RepID=UPI00074BEC85|nr:hypothetical protein [Caballeronia arationis]SAK97294.1 hypothetical protein AWB81_05469 [Caballeronia arationis]
MNRPFSLATVVRLLALIVACGGICNGVRAEQYESGVTRWRISDGQLMLVAGVLTDDSRLYYMNYSFYLQLSNEKVVMIPLVKNRSRMNDYSLNFSTFNGGDDIITDAMVAVVGRQAYLVTAHKNATLGYGRPGLVTTETYKLFEGDEAEWKYYFAPIAHGQYSEQKNLCD